MLHSSQDATMMTKRFNEPKVLQERPPHTAEWRGDKKCTAFCFPREKNRDKTSLG
jgi:hypothetical protein